MEELQKMYFQKSLIAFSVKRKDEKFLNAIIQSNIYDKKNFRSLLINSTAILCSNNLPFGSLLKLFNNNFVILFKGVIKGVGYIWIKLNSF